MFRIAEEIRIKIMFNQLNKIVMKAYSEISLTRFEFWGGAKERAKMLTYEEMEQIDEMIKELYPEGIDEITVNNLFLFEFKSAVEWLGYKYDEEKDIIIREEESEKESEK